MTSFIPLTVKNKCILFAAILVSSLLSLYFFEIKNLVILPPVLYCLTCIDYREVKLSHFLTLMSCSVSIAISVFIALYRDVWLTPPYLLLIFGSSLAAFTNVVAFFFFISTRWNWRSLLGGLIYLMFVISVVGSIGPE